VNKALDSGMNPWIVGTLIIYLITMLIVGVYFKRRMKTSKDFWVGGHSLGSWVTAISYVGSYYSTVGIIGGPSQTYKYGLGFGIWQVAGTTWLYGIIPFLFIAVQIRRMSARLGAVTLPGWLAERFESTNVRIFSALLIATMMIPYGTAIIKATGALLAGIAHVPYLWGIGITGVTVAIYLGYSGYIGLAWNDLIQGWIHLAGALLIAPLALYAVGGFDALFTKLYAISPSMLDIPGDLSWGNFMSLAFVWGFMCWGQPQLITRFYGIKDSYRLGVTMIVVTAFTTLMAGGFHLNGLLARVIYGDQFMNQLDMTIPTLAADFLPAWAAAIFVSAAVAAAMSVLASTALVAGSAIAKDIYEDWMIRKRGHTLDAKESLRISRLWTTVGLILSYVFAIDPPGIVFTLAIFAQGTLAACLTGSMFFALYWTRANWQGCLASMVIGTATTLAWFIFKGPWVHPYIPGMIASILIFPIATYMFPAPSEEAIKRAFGSVSQSA
jgi:SSS family transporter